MIDTLDGKLYQAIEEATNPDAILKAFLVRYLGDERIFLFPWQISRFVKLSNLGEAELKLFWFNTIFCRLSRSELEQYVTGFFEHATKFLEKFPDFFQESVESVTPQIIQDATAKILRAMFRTSPAMIRNRERISKKHRKVVHQVWGEALHVLRMEIEMAKEIHAEASVGSIEDDGIKWSLMVKLFEQSCLVSTEIYTLLENGFPDAALARWRTLHEIAVTFQFIQDNEETVALMFVEHQIVANYKEMKTYLERQEEMNLEKVEIEEKSRIEAEYREVLKKYGNKYKEDYGWASTVIRAERIHFADIEKSVNQDYMKPYYKIACNNIHAGAKGIYYKIGVLDHDQGLVGQSFVGLADPILLMSLSLCSVTTGLLLRIGTFTSAIEIRVLTNLAQNLQELIPQLVDTDSDE